MTRSARGRRGSRRSAAPAAPPARRRRLLKVLAALLALALAALTGLIASLNWWEPSLTAVQRQVLAATGRQHIYKEPRPLEAISPHLVHAVVAAEDSRFFHHWGIDWVEVRSAVSEVVSGRRDRPRGASTITQQLIKNLFFSTRRSYVRKVVEVALAPLVTLLVPKRRVLELYLNNVQWGPTIFGAQAAATYYYGRDASRLTREQAARLAACLPAPARRRPANMDKTSAIILRRMERLGW